MKETLFIRQLTNYFDTHLPDVRHLSENTIESYADAFALFFQFMHENQGISHTKINYKNFTPAMIESFICWLARERNYSAASIKQRLSAINSFMKYASRREMAALSAYTAVSGAEKPTVVRAPFPYFTTEEVKILLRLPNPDRKIEKRDMVLLSLFYDCGARAQEICDLKVGDIRLGTITKVKILGKRKKTRIVPVSNDVSNLLRYHLKEHGLCGKRDEPLFLSQHGKKMTTACIRNLVNKYVEMARENHPNLFAEPRYSPHSFRHSKAVHMVESGTQLIYIRNFLGHETVQSTEVYARIGQHALVKMLSERDISNNNTAALSKNKDATIYPAFLDRIRRR